MMARPIIGTNQPAVAFAMRGARFLEQMACQLWTGADPGLDAVHHFAVAQFTGAWAKILCSAKIRRIHLRFRIKRGAVEKAVRPHRDRPRYGRQQPWLAMLPLAL